jgi:cytochrome c-type biogenesis protein CcmE
MAPDRRRRIRLIVALSAALVLVGALGYTSFSSAAQVSSPSQLRSHAAMGHSYQLTGRVLPGYTRHGAQLDFRVANRVGSAATSVLVRYTGEVPDPFKTGREVIVTVHRAASGPGFIGERDSLTTKCPSKFATAPPAAKSGH